MPAFALKRPDLRDHPRDVVHRRAKVLDGDFVLEALIRNISAGGALLAFSAHTPIVDEFLVVDLPMATAHACRVVWRKGADCGVRILTSQALRGPVPGPFEAARQAWQSEAD